MIFPIYIDIETGLIIVDLWLDKKYKLKMILDTGATNTTFDSNAFYWLGYDLKNSIGTSLIETGNGIIEVDNYEIGTISGIGITKKNFHIQVYDFLAHGVLSNYDGLLGLDFLKGMKFCIDTKLNVITLTWSLNF